MDPRVNMVLHKRLKEMPIEQLTTLAQQVENLRSDPAFIFLEQTIASARYATTQALVHGSTLEHVDYTRRLGYASGLDELGETMKEILGTAEKREREIRERAEADRRAQREERAAWHPV